MDRAATLGLHGNIDEAVRCRWKSTFPDVSYKNNTIVRAPITALFPASRQTVAHESLGGSYHTLPT